MKQNRLAGFLVHGVLIAVHAMLLHLQAIRIVTTILLGDVVTVLAVFARQSDLWSDVSCLGHDLSLSHGNA